MADQPCRVLSLDGGGAKGFYTLGVLKEMEALLGRPLYQCFDLIFGTSTGGIIAALLALGYQVDDIHGLYKEQVPAVMRKRNAYGKIQPWRILQKPFSVSSRLRTLRLEWESWQRDGNSRNR